MPLHIGGRAPRRAMVKLQRERHGCPPDDDGMLLIDAGVEPGVKYDDYGYNKSAVSHLIHRGVVVVKGTYPAEHRGRGCRTPDEHRALRPYNSDDEQDTFGKRPGQMVKARKQVWLNKRNAPWSPAICRAVRKVLLRQSLIHKKNHFLDGHTLLRTMPGAKPQHLHRV